MKKPVVVDFVQLEEINKYASEKGVVVLLGHNFVYRKAVQQSSYYTKHKTQSKHTGWPSLLVKKTGLY